MGQIWRLELASCSANVVDITRDAVITRGNMKILGMIMLFAGLAMGQAVPEANQLPLLKAAHKVDQDQVQLQNFLSQAQQLLKNLQDKVALDQKAFEAAKDDAFKASKLDPKAFDLDMEKMVFVKKDVKPTK